MLNVSYMSLIACGIAIDWYPHHNCNHHHYHYYHYHHNHDFQIMIIHINFIYLLVYFMQKYSRTYCKNLHMGIEWMQRVFIEKKGMWYRWGGILLSKVTVSSLTYEDSDLICFKLHVLSLSEMSIVSSTDLNLKLWYAASDGNNDAVLAAITAGGAVNWKNNSYVSDNDI